MTEDLMTDEESIQIDNIIAEISSTQQVVVKEEPTTAVERTFIEEEKYTDDTLINMTLKKNNEVEDMANRAFDLFFVIIYVLLQV